MIVPGNGKERYGDEKKRNEEDRAVYDDREMKREREREGKGEGKVEREGERGSEIQRTPRERTAALLMRAEARQVRLDYFAAPISSCTHLPPLPSSPCTTPFSHLQPQPLFGRSPPHGTASPPQTPQIVTVA